MKKLLVSLLLAAVLMMSMMGGAMASDTQPQYTTYPTTSKTSVYYKDSGTNLVVDILDKDYWLKYLPQNPLDDSVSVGGFVYFLGAVLPSDFPKIGKVHQIILKQLAFRFLLAYWMMDRTRMRMRIRPRLSLTPLTPARPTTPRLLSIILGWTSWILALIG